MHLVALDQFLSNFSRDIGIDLGTANTPVTVRGRGVVLCEPSYVAINRERDRVVAVGQEAKLMSGKTPRNIEVIRPMRNGVIRDFDVASQMLKVFLKRVDSQGMLRPRVMIGVPSNTTEVERRAVSEAARVAGARVVYCIDQPLAGAVGADLPVLEPHACMIVDIGGGTSQVTILSLGGVVLSRSIRIAGDRLDEAIVNYVRLARNLLIGERTAEEVKIAIGYAVPPREPVFLTVKGRDQSTGLPRLISLSSSEVFEAISETLERIAEVVKETLESTPPELISDIMDDGITLVGGTSLLRGLDEYIHTITGVNCAVAQEPMFAVVKGQEKVFSNLRYMKTIFGSRRA